MYEIDHIGIVVSDMERSTKFYTDILGCKESGAYTDERLYITYLDCGDNVIELLKYLNGDSGVRGKGVIDHIAIRVPDINEAIENLKKHNVKLLFDQPRYVGGMKIMFFLGPDGERIEFVEYL